MNQSTLQASAWGLLKTTLHEWTEDNATQLAAALAYYTIFSVAPLLVIAVAIAGALLGGREAVYDHVVSEVEQYVNNREVAAFLGNMIQQRNPPASSWLASGVGLVVLLYAASGVFGELRSALNKIWDAQPKQQPGIRGLIVGSLLPLVMVLISGLLLLVSLIASTLLAGATRQVNYWLPGDAYLNQIINFFFFFLITMFVFALIYKYVPDVRIAWHDVWIGAIATALLFSVGRLLISLYLGYSSITSTYGAAGSLAALLLWVYYSAQVFFLGAEFTQVYGRTLGSRQREQGLLQTEEATAATGQHPSAGEPVVGPERGARLRPVTRALIDTAVAVGILTAISLFNLVRPPLWRQTASSGTLEAQQRGS